MEGRMDAIAVLFGNFQIKINSIQNEISKIQNLLKEYEVFGNLNQNILPNQPIVVPVIEFISRNKNINIQISNDRVNIIKPFQIDGKGNKVEYNDVDFIKIVKDIQKKLLEYYNVNGTRISYIVNFCKTSEQDIESIKGRVVSDYFYKANESFEWSSRSAVKEIFNINGHNEEINVVTSLNYNPNRIKIAIGNNALDIYGLMYNLDINTNGNNMQTRIDENFIDEFYNQTLNLIKQIEEVY